MTERERLVREFRNAKRRFEALPEGHRPVITRACLPTRAEALRASRSVR